MGHGGRVHLILHGYTPRLESEKHEPGRWNQVSFRATADFASGQATSSR